MDALMACVYERTPQSAHVNLTADHGTPAYEFGFAQAEPPGTGVYLRVP